MHILTLHTNNYRNLKNNFFDFNPKMNYIYGENAQGKTNLLESIWMFTGARTFRGTKDTDLVNFGEQSAKLEGKFYLEHRQQKIDVFFSGGKRKIFLNEIPKKYPTEVIGKFRAVLFTPIHLSLVKDGPDNRRRFIDAAMCQISSAYAKLVAQYNQTLKHRNFLLKGLDTSKSGEDTLEVWDFKLAELGSKVIRQRLGYLSGLREKAPKIYHEISRGREALSVGYKLSGCESVHGELSERELREHFLKALKKSRSTDLRRGYTSVGPHKDDLEIFLSGKSLKEFGSQGQQRSAVLALKISEAAILENLVGEPPVVLLDDVMSELDDYRKNYVLKKLFGWQTFITGCDKDLILGLDDAKVFKIKDGKAEQ